MSDLIPVNEPLISPQSKSNVTDAINSGWISSGGKYITEFEEKFSKFLGVKHAVLVTSGTAALHISLLALGIGPGDEVIVPAFTMAAAWLSVIYTGAKPVFVDCEPRTFNIDPSQISKRISRKTKAIIPVHIYGHPVDLDPIINIAKKHKLYVVEDAAEAHGAEYKNKKCGSFGTINCFSFYANKIITTGEGGMAVTDDDHLDFRLRKFRDHFHSDKKRFIHEGIGYNYRITNLQAAVGCGEIDHINEYIKRKRNMAKTYSALLHEIPGIKLPVEEKYAKCVYWMYAITIDSKKFGMSKDELRIQLKLREVDTRDFFYSPSDQPALKNYLSQKDKFPITDKAAHEGLYLPSGLALTPNQINQVCCEIKAIHFKALNQMSNG